MKRKVWILVQQVGLLRKRKS